MASKYNNVYNAFLKEDESVEKVADLIEAIKKASVLGWDGNHFSELATADILDHLYLLLPNLKIINTNSSHTESSESNAQV